MYLSFWGLEMCHGVTNQNNFFFCHISVTHYIPGGCNQVTEAISFRIPVIYCKILDRSDSWFKAPLVCSSPHPHFWTGLTWHCSPIGSQVRVGEGLEGSFLFIGHHPTCWQRPRASLESLCLCCVLWPVGLWGFSVWEEQTLGTEAGCGRDRGHFHGRLHLPASLKVSQGPCDGVCLMGRSCGWKRGFWDRHRYTSHQGEPPGSLSILNYALVFKKNISLC